MAVIFVLALITIAFAIYSDAALTSAEVSHTAAPGPCDGGRRQCGQTRLGAKVAGERGINLPASALVS
jgi:hypothetical protein